MLTQKQESFCLAYIETGNATESYRRAYSPKNMTDKSVNEKGSQMLASVKIKSRLEELRAPVREKAMLTLEGHLQRLEDLSNAAEAAGNYGAAITAETNRGKAAGLYAEKMELTGKDGAPVEIIQMTPEAIKKVMEKDDC